MCASTRIHYTHLHLAAYTGLALSGVSHALTRVRLRSQTRTNLALARCHIVHAHMALHHYFLIFPVLHTQYSRQCRDALSRRHAQQNENGKEYCRQKKNNGAEGRAEPGGEALCSGSRIMEQNQHNSLKNNET